jgi:hypothetical protein
MFKKSICDYIVGNEWWIGFKFGSVWSLVLFLMHRYSLRKVIVYRGNNGVMEHCQGGK